MASELRLPRVNIVVLSGRLTRDVELRYTPSGTPVSKLSIAFDRSFQKNGEWVQETSYIDAIVWSKRGEQCAESLHKGSAVLIEGSLKTRSYKDKDNQNRKITEINVSRINFLERNERTGGFEQTSSVKPKMNVASDITDDDVPF